VFLDPNQVGVLISSFFLLIADGILVAYLWRRSGFRRDYIPLHPNKFLLLSGAALSLSAVFTVILGAAHAALGIALAVGVVVSVLHPVAALCFLLSYLFQRPMEMLPINALSYSMTKILAGSCFLSWIIASMHARRLTIYLSVNALLYAALLCWLFASAGLSTTAEVSVQYVFGNFLPTTAVVFLIANVISDEQDLRALRAVFVSSVVGVITSAIALTYQGGAEVAVIGSASRLESVTSFGNANDLAALAVMALPFCVLPLFTRGVAARGRLWLALGFGLLLYGLLLCESRGAMLALGAGALLYILLKVTSRWRLPLAVSAVLLPLVLMQFISRAADDLNESSDMRKIFIINGLKMAKSHPIFGVGVNNYPEYGAALGQIRATAHSSWILILAETGVMGFIFFTALFFVTAWDAWQLRSKAPEFLISLAAYGVAITFLSHPYLFVPYVLWAFTLAASRVMAPALAAAPVKESA
jgi:O-antigen ligase